MKRIIEKRPDIWPKYATIPNLIIWALEQHTNVRHHSKKNTILEQGKPEKLEIN